MCSILKTSTHQLSRSDIPHVIDYWYNCTDEYLISLGADPDKFPSKDAFIEMLENQLSLSDKDKKGFAMIWNLNGVPIGHNNINQINYGKDAYMHLHIWKPELRIKGLGTSLLTQSIPHFFKKFDLNKIYCEPFADNPAPNKTLPKLGFTFEKSYFTTPGSINYEQKVNRWVLEKHNFKH